jgi:uroporphyrin-III C-methyltransferase
MTVHLVGAGPGDPDLLTVKAARLISEADVIVHDRLVSAEILRIAAPWAELVDVGKIPGSRRNSQEEINAILIDRGRSAETVVRLKGGDPFVFGRGGEEAQELCAASIDVEVVPGISSAIAGPASAGIPVTMRGASSGVTVITAHQEPGTDRTIDWDAAARLGTTLVVLMGVKRASDISARLIAGGLAHDTPVAVVTNATRPNQSTLRGQLRDLGSLARTSPSILVVGEVAALDVTETLSATLPVLL